MGRNCPCSHGESLPAESAAASGLEYRERNLPGFAALYAMRRWPSAMSRAELKTSERCSGSR